ncbi:MAG TPA: hypothetical protein PLK40_05240 [Bacteroidaceae bacterium]|nr:hypothetical protein [Bacteroidaceae bacterium]
MASRRNLKKGISYVMGELFTETVTFRNYIPGIDPEKADAVLGKILAAHEDFIMRISHTEPGNVKGYYKKFGEDFHVIINEILQDMNNLKTAPTA